MKDKIDKRDIESLISKLKPLIEKVDLKGEKAKEMFENMKAYLEDSKYFMKTGDLVRSFEAIVWAWSIFELCENLKIFKIKKETNP